MMSKTHVLFPLVVLSATCFGQWSAPISVGDSASHVECFQVAAGGGDTAWAFYLGYNGGPAPKYVFCHQGTGDSWSAQETLATGTNFLFCLSAGVDPQQRVWLAWYDGNYYALGDTWGIYTLKHDTSGWGNVDLALPAEGITGLNFAADKSGTWHMGVNIQSAPYPNLFESACYARFQGDTWALGDLATGSPDPYEVDYGLPTLVARPDSGFWAVYGRRAYQEEDRVLIDHLVPFSYRANYAVLLGATGLPITPDSVGQMWAFIGDTLGAVWSITYGVEGERRRQMVTPARLSGPVECTDAMGWVWVFWEQSDSTLAVSCNWGNQWSKPEVVTSMRGYPEQIVSDPHGRVYVCFSAGGRYWTCYRTSRPGIGGDIAVKQPAARRAASVVRALPNDVVVFDAMGRRVVNPRSGVFFLREEGRGVGGAARTRKVVLQH